MIPLHEAPTERQLSYLRDLLKGKQLTPDVEREREMIPRYNKKEISRMIGVLLALPWKAVAPVVPVYQAPVKEKAPIGEGFYAITDPLDGVLKFFEVNAPTKGAWVGYTFLAQMASDRHLPIKEKNEQDRIFSLIAVNPQEAMILYGKKIGKCGYCNRILTDEESRMRGIGPICAGLLTRRHHALVTT